MARRSVSPGAAPIIRSLVYDGIHEVRAETEKEMGCCCGRLEEEGGSLLLFPDERKETESAARPETKLLEK